MRPVEGEMLLDLHEHAPASGLRLPRPDIDPGKSFADALRLRSTTRAISPEAIDARTLSNLLYAACGVNREEGPFGAPGLTAASASNSQEIDVYVARARGAYRFDPRRHQLVQITHDDVRLLAFTPGQPLLAPDAPVQLVYVVDVDRLEHTQGFEESGLHDPEVQKAYFYVDTGIIAGNVYLYCAASGLACWFHNCDRAGLARAFRLRPTQRVLFAQTVGRPA
jgi:hypothetical protein